MTRPLAIAFLLLSALLASAQDSAPAANASSIAGTVVKEPGREPLKKVLVQVVAEDQKQGGNYTASTDADGHFRIENVVPGRYRLYLEKNGLVEVNGRGSNLTTTFSRFRPVSRWKTFSFACCPRPSSAAGSRTKMATRCPASPSSRKRKDQERQPAKPLGAGQPTILVNTVSLVCFPASIGLSPCRLQTCAITNNPTRSHRPPRSSPITATSPPTIRASTMPRRPRP